VGLAVPGIVDIVSGVGILSANLGWRNAPVARTVARDLGLPVVMAHDVTAAGLAEYRLGAGRGADDVVVVVVGTGISAALVVGGRIVTGGIRQAGELGHVVVRPGGPRCGCGRLGCLEAVASAAAIARAYSAASGTPVPGAAEVYDRLGSDAVADAVWAQAVSDLADGLLMATGLLGSSRIVVGGGLSRAGEALLAPLRAHLAERATVEAVPEVVAAELGARAGLVGAALAARDPRLLDATVHAA
jgi:glucokinase